MLFFHAISYMFISHVLPSWMDLYSMDMMLGVFMLTHIPLLHAGTIARMQDPYYGFHCHMVYIDCFGLYQQLLL